MSLDEEHSVHDVAALLKEFLRDMPDPLLPRELYTAFINTMCECTTHTLYNNTLHSHNSSVIHLKSNVNLWLVFSAVLDHSEQESAIQLLMFLLPPCNSDTLQRLLGLLSTVAAHAEDSRDSEGHEVKELHMPCLYMAVQQVWSVTRSQTHVIKAKISQLVINMRGIHV